MTKEDLQSFLARPYQRDGWLQTLRGVLPQTQIFASPQALATADDRAESVFQLGRVQLQGDRQLGILEVRVGEDTDLDRNRVGLRNLVTRFIDQAEYHGVLAVFLTKRPDYRFTFAARETALDDSGQLVRSETSPRRYTYLLGPNESCRTAAERFDLLARTGDLATIADVRAAFDKEPLTREFFKRFEKAIEAVKTDLERHQALPSAQAYSRAQLLLERLLFLYFVQNRGWLNQQRNYLLDNFKSHRVIPDEFSYYADFLDRVLFTLSTPPDFKGPGAGVRLQGLPFLNGGLFDDDEFAQTHERKKDNPPLHVRNATFAAVFESLLEAFNFTAHEDTPLDQDVAVDPEMLGKVFESIVLHAEAADPDAVAPDKRKATGSYYTSRIVVHFICRESLCQYLLPRLTAGKDWNRRLRALLEIPASDGLGTEDLALLKTLLTPAEGRQILDLIRGLKCLDPSVGSGAFPVGLLHELVNLRRLCEAAALGYVDPVRKHGNQWVHEQKAEIVENCLYGVDLQQQAIEICRLRLWLSLVVDYDLGCDPFTADEKSFRAAIRDISQLPNLEMNFRRGDSLLDMISGVHIRVNSDLLTGRSDEVREIQKLAHELHTAKSAEKKKKLRLEILRRRFELSQRVLADEKKLLRASQQVGDLFGGDEGTDAEKRRRAEAEIEQLDKALAKLVADRKELEKLATKPMAADFYRELRKLEGADFDSPFNFVWRIDYAEIFTGKHSVSTLAGDLNLGDELTSAPRPGGFDLIVGNPPFVTARNPVKRELYRAKWMRVCHMKFLLVCPFFDLSFGLLKPDGQLGFIVSNAFAKREFGQPLIEDFFPTVDLQKVVDCSGLLFPGHGTPTCIVFGAQRKPDDKKPIRVAATLPGGGDLRAQPEESPLWHALAAQHDNPGFSNKQVVVSDRSRKEMAKHPWAFDSTTSATTAVLEKGDRTPLIDVLADEVGVCTMTNADDIFFATDDSSRRNNLPPSRLPFYHQGEELKNWEAEAPYRIALPYEADCQPTPEQKLEASFRNYLRPFKRILEDRHTFANLTFKQAGRTWYEFERMNANKYSTPKFITFAHIATHNHFAFVSDKRVFGRHAQVIKLPAAATDNEHHLLTGFLNSATVLFWFKQACFNKGAGEDEHRDRFEYSGTKVQQLPMPAAVTDGLRGKPGAPADRLTALSRACWERGRELPSLALRKLFEKPGEAYHAWNAALPGHVPPHAQLPARFTTTEQLREAVTRALAVREKLRAEMIALQEEMDWLVYRAYALLPADHPSADLESEILSLKLAENERPFRLWAKDDGDFAKAVALIPAGWSKSRRALWETRLAAIRDNEHIRRIEAPVYKRRWDEQWKVSNQWLAGPAAYAQELVDAFRWWLAEKAEWYLEHKAKGGPLALDAWTAALASDVRVQAAWPVIADALNQVELWKLESNGKKSTASPKPDASSAAFTRFFRDTVNDETVPDGIPPAIPWEELEKKMKVPKQAKNVRGKLNVPRERFRSRDGTYLWAGGSL
ncbi:MAG: Eco57I restriction-modification methylase domain-containing protein [Limisphaerales bacterium]